MANRTVTYLGILAFVGCSGSVGGGPNGDGPVAGQADAPLVLADGGGPVACISGLDGLTLAPADMTVSLDGTAAAPLTFTATGHFSDGHTATIDPNKLAFSVSRTDDTAAGTMAGNVLTPNAQGGGTVTVSATDGCITGQTTVHFVLTTTVGSPSDPGAWGGTPVTTGAPIIVYPSDQTRFPRNIYRTLFQWRTQGFAQFRLIFAGPGATVTVYSDGQHPLCTDKNPAAGCWEADAQSWSLIAGSNAGQTVTMTLDALDTSGDTSGAAPVVRRAAPITLGFSKRDVRGAIFYWSTTSAGIRRANVASSVPEDYVTGKPGTRYPSGTQVKCVACHVVSRDGKYLAAPLASSTNNGLTIFDVTLAAPPTIDVTAASTMGHGFATFSPDDASLVAAYGGKMWQLARTDAAHLVDLPLGAVKGTHPDWSPDGKQLVFATGAGDAPAGAGIALLAYGGGTTWTGPPQTLVPAAGKTNLFPSFSPDGKWIAYARGKGGHDDLTAQLFLVSADGSGGPVELVRANRLVSNVLGDGQTSNTEPTWAPPGDLAWIAFNSRRAYGVVQPDGTEQIWVAAVDLASGSVDPSFPAFRLQFQGLEENNHRAFWTTDIRELPPTPDGGVAQPADAGTCVLPLAACDPVADTCCNAEGAVDRYVCDTVDDGVTYLCLKQIG